MSINLYENNLRMKGDEEKQQGRVDARLMPGRWNRAAFLMEGRPSASFPYEYILNISMNSEMRARGGLCIHAPGGDRMQWQAEA